MSKIAVVCLMLISLLTPAQAKKPALFTTWDIKLVFQKGDSMRTQKQTGKKFWKHGNKQQKFLDWSCEFNAPEMQVVQEGMLRTFTTMACIKKDGTIVMSQAACYVVDGNVVPSAMTFSLGNIYNNKAVHINIQCGFER